MTVFIQAIISLVQIILCMKGIYQIDFVEKKSRVGIAVVLEIVMLFLYTKINMTDWMFCYNILMEILIVNIIFEGRFCELTLKDLFAVFFADSVIAPIDTIIYILLRHHNIQWLIGARELMEEIFLCIVIVIIIYTVKKNANVKKFIRDIPNIYFGIGFLLSLCAAGISVCARFMMKDANVALKDLIDVFVVIIMEFVYLFAIFLIYVDYNRKEYKRESMLKSEYLKMSKEHYCTLNHHMKEIRGIKHDMQAHLNVLYEYIEREQWNEAKKYLEEMNVNFSKETKLYINVGNDLVNSVINSKMKDAEPDIFLQCNGSVPYESNVSDYDLCTIFSNVLSNAIEACRKLERSEKKIEIEIQSFQEHMVIRQKNPIEWSVDEKLLGEITSKKNKEEHGYGIANIKSTVEKYNGEVRFLVDEEKFSVCIII